MSEIKILDSSAYPKVLNLYYSQSQQFPLVISVLTQKQNGIVYWDGIHDIYLIIHSFGFCQYVTLESNPTIEDLFFTLICEQKKFIHPKLRFYAVNEDWLGKIYCLNDKSIAVIDRIQFKYRDIPAKNNKINYAPTLLIQSITDANIENIETELGLELESRFWPSKISFLENTFGTAVLNNTQPTSICYACALTPDYAEIDIFTHADYRGSGMGSIALMHFLQQCHEKNVSPHWDCYANNLPSVNLAKKMGFEPYNEYSHVIIEK